MSRHKSRDLEEQYLRIVALHLRRPADDAPDEDWDAWADLQHVQSLLAGWFGRAERRETAWTDVDDGYRRELHNLVALPGFLRLVGEQVATDARVVVDRLHDLLVTQ